MPSVRRLAAILAADVAGYSRLMGADEEGTHERLKAHLGQLVNPKISQHRGRTVKNTGDGMLAEFGSVVDAVRCAVEVQRGMADRNAGASPEKQIKFRVGVNLGDVIAEGEDIYGDGVNVAARLEGLAEPGGICISRVDPRQAAISVRGQGRAVRQEHRAACACICLALREHRRTANGGCADRFAAASARRSGPSRVSVCSGARHSCDCLVGLAGYENHARTRRSGCGSFQLDRPARSCPTFVDCRGRRVGTAEGRVIDRDGRLLVHGTTTCLIFDM